ncbi:MAG TPA: type II secretion system protein GspG [Verrucomicrobiae bacterium]|jgi:hypothetical protein
MLLPAEADFISETKGKAVRKKYWLLRVSVALCVWVVITQISLHVAWHQAQRPGIAWNNQWRTRQELESISNAIAMYGQEFGTAPASLEQLATNGNGGSFWASYGRDCWGNPLVFYWNGTNSVVMSYGRDGMPGGVGEDCDLTTQSPSPKEALPTFQQFLKNQWCRGMVVSSYVCGGLAALLSLLTVRIPNLRTTGIIILLLSLAATILGTLWTATVITALHYPSGH